MNRERLENWCKLVQEMDCALNETKEKESIKELANRIITKEAAAREPLATQLADEVYYSLEADCQDKEQSLAVLMEGFLKAIAGLHCVMIQESVNEDCQGVNFEEVFSVVCDAITEPRVYESVMGL